MSENFTFIEKQTLSDYLRAFGWILTNQTKNFGDKTILKADFYDKGVCIATSMKGGRIYCDGKTKVLYKDTRFDSVSELLETYPNAVSEYSEWIFIQEKEWVLAKHTEQLLTFSTLSQWPKASKFRC